MQSYGIVMKKEGTEPQIMVKTTVMKVKYFWCIDTIGECTAIKVY